ncbi:hypothetical protein BG418_12110 [Streptomyces sp. CBMA152]|nr:hypothetical protein [Streptomyces sp. CBMA152]
MAVAEACGFCRQLRADLAANAKVLQDLRASVVLVEDGRCTVLGLPAPPGLAPLAEGLARSGTPSAVLLVPGAAPRAAMGYDQVSAVLIELTGGRCGGVLVEAPTNCSVKVASHPVDGLFAVRCGDGRLLGLATRGEQAREAAGPLASVPHPGYLPVTLIVERPANLYLLFRGGELLTRARTAEELAETLGRVLAGFTALAEGQVTLGCGTLVHPRGQAVLFPRNWMSDLVVRAARLQRVGWRIRPEPHAVLLPGGLLQVTGAGATMPVAAAWASPLGGPPTRARYLAQVVNWLVRPAPRAAVNAMAAIARELTVHTGTWQDALAHLTAGPPP